jgi:hypothetical protein
VPITTAYSTQPLPQAVHDLQAQSGEARPRLILFFASTNYDARALSAGLQDVVEDVAASVVENLSSAPSVQKAFGR